jgi:hypothetical protein
MISPKIAFNAIDPCARVSGHNLESRWYKIIESKGYHFLGLSMSLGNEGNNSESQIDDLRIKQSDGLFIACRDPQGDILPNFASIALRHIDSANKQRKPVFSEVALQICLDENKQRLTDRERMIAAGIIDCMYEVVIGDDIGKISQELGVR